VFDFALPRRSFISKKCVVLQVYNRHNVMSGHFSLKWQVRAAAREQLG
jgi:hypothetical protein